MYDSALADVLILTTNEDYLIEWIQSEYGIESQDIEIVDLSDGTHYIRWYQGDVRYDATIDSDNVLLVTAYWLDNAPKGIGILTCLGNPDVYQVNYIPGDAGTLTLASLWYGEKGVTYDAALFPVLFGWRSPLNENTPFETVTYVGVQSTEALLQKRYGDLSRADEARIRKNLRVWSSWENIVIE